MAGAARVAAATYLGDAEEFDKAWDTYRRFAGDRRVGPALTFNENARTWSHNPDAAVAVNPAGSTTQGHRVDGATLNDIGRDGRFAGPARYTQYQWERTVGIFVQAQLLARSGYPVGEAQDAAPRRVIECNRHLADEFGDRWWDHTDWAKYLANHVYGLDLPVNGPADEGKDMAWTHWTFG